MPSLVRDIGYALRQTRRSPGFTLMAVLTLALGIGANTAIFTVVDAVLLRPLPGVASPSRLVSLYRVQHNDAFDSMGYPDYADLRDRNTSLSALAAFSPVSMSLSRGTPERIIGSVVTGNYFSTLGVRPALGRPILPSDDTEPGAHPVAVLSHALWTRRFGADRGAVGATVLLNGYSFTIVGVAPPSFRGTLAGLPAEVWVPLSMLSEAMPNSVGRHYFDERAWGWLRVFGRLKPDVAFTQAEAELKGISRQLALAYPNTNADRTVALTAGVGLDPDDRATLSRFLALLLAGVGLLLVIACANVAGMLLLRGIGRQREIAVRLALGASRIRLVRQLLTEGLFLAFAGGTLGLLAAPWAVKLSVSLAQPASVVRSADLTPDARILFFTLLVCLLTGIAAALAPALRSSSADLTTPLKQGTPAAGRMRSLPHNLLVIGQVGLSFVLLMGAGLLVRGMHRILTADPGFDSRNVFLATLDLTGARSGAFYRGLFDRLQSMHGAVSASLATSVPPDEWPGAVSIFHPGEDPPQNVLRGHEFQLGTRVNFVSVAPHYFHTLGIPLLAGRDFTPRDNPDAPLVAIVSRNLARRFWPSANAIGQRIAWPTLMGPPRPPLEVVGVVADCKYRSLVDDAPLLMYVPLFQNFSPGTTIIVRTASAPLTALESVRGAVGALDKGLPVFGVRTMRAQAELSLWQQRMATGLIGVFGLLSLFLSSLGVYGAMAHSVARRTREIGVRMALGAARNDILKEVAGQAFRLVGIGLAVGIAGGFFFRRFLSAMMVSVQSAEPLTVVAAGIVLIAAALLASYLPARRAIRVDPVVALRSE
ncbi:MAG TPA: ABC transporter permease [Bryobacteraceae bacterium]|nr:ABC transporter permease [Bryobacteraceae bacterium]